MNQKLINFLQSISEEEQQELANLLELKRKLGTIGLEHDEGDEKDSLDDWFDRCYFTEVKKFLNIKMPHDVEVQVVPGTPIEDRKIVNKFLLNMGGWISFDYGGKSKDMENHDHYNVVNAVRHFLRKEGNSTESGVMPIHDFCKNWLFEIDEKEEAAFAHVMCAIAEKNGLTSNDALHLITPILRMLKSNCSWVKNS